MKEFHIGCLYFYLLSRLDYKRDMEMHGGRFFEFERTGKRGWERWIGRLGILYTPRS